MTLEHSILLSFSLLAFSPAVYEIPNTVVDDSGITVAYERGSKPSNCSRVQKAKSQVVITAEGRVKLGDGKLFHVHSILSGRISKDNAVVGKYFRKGESLALLESTELVKLCADYLTRLEQVEMSIRQRESSARLARKELERMQKLVEEGIVAEKDRAQAEEDVRTANEDLEDLNEQRVRLENEVTTLTKMYGIKSLNIKQDTVPSELPINAPDSGIVTVKNVTLGDRVEPNEAAYVMASVRQLNLSVVLPATDRGRVAVGQHVDFICDNISRKCFPGVISSIVASKESPTDFSVNVILENPQSLLRPDMVGQAKIFVD